MFFCRYSDYEIYMIWQFVLWLVNDVYYVFWIFNFEFVWFFEIVFNFIIG